MKSVFLIDAELEFSLIKKVCSEVKEKFEDLPDISKVGVICVSPDYSGTVGMRVFHNLVDKKFSEGFPEGFPEKFPEYICVDTPLSSETADQEKNYKVIIEVLAPYLKQKLEKLVLVSSFDSNHYTWIKEGLLKANFAEEDLTFVSLVESKDSVFNADIVGEHIDLEPKFWWEIQ
jgi:hypothetical protein